MHKPTLYVDWKDDVWIFWRLKGRVNQSLIQIKNQSLPTPDVGPLRFKKGYLVVLIIQFYTVPEKY